MLEMKFIILDGDVDLSTGHSTQLPILELAGRNQCEVFFAYDDIMLTPSEIEGTLLQSRASGGYRYRYIVRYIVLSYYFPYDLGCRVHSGVSNNPGYRVKRQWMSGFI